VDDEKERGEEASDCRWDDDAESAEAADRLDDLDENEASLSSFEPLNCSDLRDDDDLRDADASS
jgi:hypothetical protein